MKRRMRLRSVGYGRLAGVLAVVGLSYSVFRYAGGFSSSQSQVLCLLVFMLLARHTIRPAGTIPPLRFTLSPNWERILIDQKLIEEKDIDLLNSYCAPEGEQFATLLKSIELDVLSPSLFYTSKYDIFTTKWLSHEDIFCRLPKDQQSLAALKKTFPSLFRDDYAPKQHTVRLHIEQGVIYLITEESMKRGGGYFSIRENGIPLATVPSFLFTYYYGFLLSEIPFEETVSRFEELGWARDDSWDDSEYDPPWAEYRHKYFWLRYQYL